MFWGGPWCTIPMGANPTMIGGGVSRSGDDTSVPIRSRLSGYEEEADIEGEPRAFFFRRYTRKTKRPISAKPPTPPTAPPTIAAVLGGECLDGLGKLVADAMLPGVWMAVGDWTAEDSGPSILSSELDKTNNFERFCSDSLLLWAAVASQLLLTCEGTLKDIENR